MSTSATREATNSESAAIWRVMVRVYDKKGTATVVDPEGSAPPPRPYFYTKLRPEGRNSQIYIFVQRKKTIDPSRKSTFVSFWPNEQNSLEIKGNHKC